MILNDLYVSETMCGQGIGRALPEAACESARRAEAVRLGLETERTNETAQRLYESADWKKCGHIHYGFDL